MTTPATNLLLANKFLGPSDSMTAGRLWFVEVVVWILVALAAGVLAAHRRSPGTAVAVRIRRGLPRARARAALRRLRVRAGQRRLVHGARLLVLRRRLGGRQGDERVAAARRDRRARRRASSGTSATRSGKLLVFAGLTLLIWLPAMRCPAALTVAAGMVAEASLFIYLTHYQVYPLFGAHKAIGVIASVVVGVLLTQLLTHGAQANSGSAAADRQPCDGSRSAMSPSCTRVAAMTPSAPTRLPVITPRPRAAAGRPGLQQIPLIGADRAVKPDRRVGGSAAVGARHHRVTVHRQRRVDHVDVGDVGRDDGVQQADRRAPAPSPATTADGRTRQPERSSSTRMSSSSNGIDGAGPAGPVCGERARVAPAATRGVRARGRPGRSTNDTLAVVSSRPSWRESTRRAAAVRPSKTASTVYSTGLACLTAPQELQVHVGRQPWPGRRCGTPPPGSAP